MSIRLFFRTGHEVVGTTALGVFVQTSIKYILKAKAGSVVLALPQTRPESVPQMTPGETRAATVHPATFLPGRHTLRSCPRGVCVGVVATTISPVY